MVATSVCARGLDIKHIKVVINYMCPNHSEDYVHRVGRTGRAGNKGTAYTFITPEECAYAADLIRALENSGNPVPDELRKLDEEYQQKVLDGEMEKKKSNLGFAGKGFEFTESEESKVKEFRKELSKAYGLGVEENDEIDEDGDMVKTAQQKEEERRKLEGQQILQLLEKDPNARKIAMEAGNKASIKSLKEGLSHDEAKQIAQEAMILVLK
jgi:ATP-dependent RNA helicase DDX46/PRP5